MALGLYVQAWVQAKITVQTVKFSVNLINVRTL